MSYTAPTSGNLIVDLAGSAYTPPISGNLTIDLAVSDTDPPNLPNLYVKDAETRENIPVAGLDGWGTEFLQTQTISFAPLSFSEGGLELSADGETSKFWCRRLSKILVNCRFSDSGANAVILPIYYDKNDVACYGAEITVTAISTMVGTVYGATLAELSSYGANKIGFKVVSVSAGTVDIYAAGV